MSDFNNNLAAVRRRFKPAEMMLLAGSAMGCKVDPVGFAEKVRRDVAASSGVFPMIIKKYRIDAEYLVTKLQATSPELMEVLLARLGDWQQLDVDEMMAENGLPSVSTLSRLGLVEPAGVAAWGLVCLRHASAIYEFVLNRPERMRVAESRTEDAVAADLIQLVEAAASPMDDATVLDCVYRLVKVTGLRRCLVVADDRGVRVTEIPVKDLLQDLYQGALKGVVLAGVNAPDSVEHQEGNDAPRLAAFAAGPFFKLTIERADRWRAARAVGKSDMTVCVQQGKGVMRCALSYSYGWTFDRYKAAHFESLEGSPRQWRSDLADCHKRNRGWKQTMHFVAGEWEPFVPAEEAAA